MSSTKEFVIEMSESDSMALSDIAQFLEVPRWVVIQKGLQLMALYAKTKEAGSESVLVFRSGGVDQVLDVLGEES